MRKLAVELGCSASIVSRSVSDFGLHSYSLKRDQFLTDSMKERRVVKASALINNLKHESAGFLKFVMFFCVICYQVCVCNVSYVICYQVFLG